MSALPPLDPGERDSFRAFLHALDRRGELARIATPFDPAGFDVSACLAALDDGPALLFAAADAAGIPLAGNVVNSIDRIALGLETSRAALGERIAGAIARPLAPTPAARAPVQDVEMKPDLDALPIPRFFEHETGPYITAGCIVARDAATGRGNVSFARLKPLGGARALIGIAPNHHLAVLARAAGERGQRLPIAVTLGNHPSVLVAAALYLDLGDDELEVAGALLAAFSYDDRVLLERYVQGRELAVGVLGDQPLPVVEAIPREGDRFDFEARYEIGRTDYICPAELSDDESADVAETALAAYELLGCSGFARVDLMLGTEGPEVLEVNAIPGLTDTSLFPMAAEAAGFGFEALVERIVALALEEPRGATLPAA